MAGGSDVTDAAAADAAKLSNAPPRAIAVSDIARSNMDARSFRIDEDRIDNFHRDIAVSHRRVKRLPEARAPGRNHRQGNGPAKRRAMIG